jgi:3-deoxy-D-arabino-heptulosonate 7-phosphate (DAHP) synthase class II
MTRDPDAEQDPIAQVRNRIQQLEVEIIDQNEIISTLERIGRDSREARAMRAQLWLSHEAALVEMERLLAEKAQAEPPAT